MKSLAIDAHAVRKSYGTHAALRGIDLQAETGTICGLVGPNGAGKSTMLRILVDLLRADGGTVRVLGEDPRGNAPLRARIGYLPGELRVATRASGHAYLRQLARITGTDLGLAHELAERLGAGSAPARARTIQRKQAEAGPGPGVHAPA